MATHHPPHRLRWPVRPAAHAGNIFALRDGRIAYVDFGNVAELSQRECGRRMKGKEFVLSKEVRGSCAAEVASPRTRPCRRAGLSLHPSPSSPYTPVHPTLSVRNEGITRSLRC